MDEVMQEILSNFKEGLFKKLYADDLVGITKFKHMKILIDVAKKVFSKFDFIFNSKKSQIFRVKKRKFKQQQIGGLDIV